MKQMSGRDESATITVAAEAHADNTPKSKAAIELQGQQRDPFDHPALRRIVKNGAPAQSLTAEALAAQEAARMTPPGSKVPVPSTNGAAVSVLRLLPDLTQAPVALPSGRAPTLITPTSPKSAGAGDKGSVQEADDPMKSWHLTAIIAGQYPRAVIEGSGPGSCQVGVGERLHGLKVLAIQEREIVLSDAHHLYTLPLMAAPSMQQDTKDTSAETIIENTRENARATAKIQPR